MGIHVARVGKSAAHEKGDIKKRTRRAAVESRAQLIDAAAQIVAEEGISAVTAGRLAEKVGLQRQIIHYYFGTIEELLVALVRRDFDRFHLRLGQSLGTDEPLRSLHELCKSANITNSGLGVFHQKKALRAEVKRQFEQQRRTEAESLARHLRVRGIEPRIPPVAMAMVIQTLSNELATEEALGITEGHAEVEALVEELLQAFAERGDWKLRDHDSREPKKIGRRKPKPRNQRRSKAAH